MLKTYIKEKRDLEEIQRSRSHAPGALAMDKGSDF